MQTAPLLLLLAISATAFAEVFKVPLKHVESKRQRMMREGTWSAYVKQKQLTKAGTHDQQLQKDYDDMLYVGVMNLGTPGQDFNMIMDTGSADLWIPDKTCSGACDGHHKFNGSKSSTFTNDGGYWSIQYGTGSANGFEATDKVCFGAPDLCLKQQKFGLARQIAQFFRNEPMDGICGLAFKAISMEHVTPPLIELMPQLDKKFIQVWMTAVGFNQKPGGQITYGGLDDKHCDNSKIDWVTLSSDTYYEYELDKVCTGGYCASGGWLGKFKAISDTGTSFVAGPQKDVENLAQKVGATYDSQNQVYMIDCNAKPDPIVFTINGISYSVEYKNYIVPADKQRSSCYFAFEAFNAGFFGPNWILGDTFIRQFCHVFDPLQGRIGISKAKM
jgi:hypothetical protein